MKRHEIALGKWVLTEGEWVDQGHNFKHKVAPGNGIYITRGSLTVDSAWMYYQQCHEGKWSYPASTPSRALNTAPDGTALSKWGVAPFAFRGLATIYEQKYDVRTEGEDWNLAPLNLTNALKLVRLATAKMANGSIPLEPVILVPFCFSKFVQVETEEPGCFPIPTVEVAR